jgi:DNA-binding NtrC family response regulator
VPAPTFSDVPFEEALADDLGGAYDEAVAGSAYESRSYEPEVIGGEGALFADAADLPDFDASDAEFEVEEEGPPDGPNQPLAAEGEGAEGLARLLARGRTLPTVEQAERALIVEALRRFDGNRRQTADALGISERTLYRKIKELEEEGVDV